MCSFFLNERDFYAKTEPICSEISPKCKWSPHVSASGECRQFLLETVETWVDHNKAIISSGFPMPKTIGEAVGTSRNKKKHCASKLHLRPTLTIPTHSHAAVKNKRCFSVPTVPAAEQSYQAGCQLGQVQRSASPGIRRASAL